MRVINIVEKETNDLIASISENNIIIHDDYEVIEWQEEDDE
ncbi:hypothetical protein [Sporosarcina sp. P34]|nr:hypothetical protein [Sporosarcina sp. P34]